MTRTEARAVLYAAAMGLFFALVQTGYFFQLQFRITAAYPSFLTVTLAWLIGSAAGLWLTDRPGAGRWRGLFLGASLAAYYAVLILLRLCPYRAGWLPVLGCLIAVSGLQAGEFFGTSRALFSSASRLFFWENNGFILGWVVGFAGYVQFGSRFHWAAPALTGLMAGALGARAGAGDTRVRSGDGADHASRSRVQGLAVTKEGSR